MEWICVIIGACLIGTGGYLCWICGYLKGTDEIINIISKVDTLEGKITKQTKRNRD